MFDEYANIIQQEYPEIIVQGNNYDPPGMNMFLARLIVSMASLIRLQLAKCIILSYHAYF